MSQSDYLRRKRVSTVLRVDPNENPIYSSKQLLAFKQYQIENNVTSSNISYRKIKPAGKQVVYEMVRDVTNCPTFICENTSQRPNRVAHVGRMCNNHPLNWWEKKANEVSKELWCKCQLNRSYTNENRCSCITASPVASTLEIDLSGNNLMS